MMKNTKLSRFQIGVSHLFLLQKDALRILFILLPVVQHLSEQISSAFLYGVEGRAYFASDANAAKEIPLQPHLIYRFVFLLRTFPFGKCVSVAALELQVGRTVLPPEISLRVAFFE